MASERMQSILQKHLEQLYQEWEALLAQLSYTLGEVDRLRLERQALSLEQKIRETENKLNPPTVSDSNQKVAPEVKELPVKNKSIPHLINNQSKETDLFVPSLSNENIEWRLPQLLDILNKWERHSMSDDVIRQNGRMIQETLALFDIPADFEGAYKGARVTCYLIKLGYLERMTKGEIQRIKIPVNKIIARSDDLALALAASNIRIETPVPGTNYIGIEIPNQKNTIVSMKEVMESDIFEQRKGRLCIVLGEDVKGQPIVLNLEKAPYFLIAGETDSGKSTCLHSIVSCLLLTHTPDTLRLLMIDLKMVDLNIYNGVPHLLSPVVTKIAKAIEIFLWAIKEMERRYLLFSKAGVRDLAGYNEFLTKRNQKNLPNIVIIVDEIADLMTTVPEQAEKSICRLAQMARATGIYLIIATRQITNNVITKQIKANFPARIALAVTHQADSRLILDMLGAEKLLSKGDMLFRTSAASSPIRIQGAYVGEQEINKLVRYWTSVLDPSQIPLHKDKKYLRQLEKYTAHYQVGSVNYSEKYPILSPYNNKYIGEIGMEFIAKNGLLQNNPHNLLALEVWLFDKNDQINLEGESCILLSEYAVDHDLAPQFLKAGKVQTLFVQPNICFQLESQSLLLRCEISEVIYRKNGLTKGIFESVKVEMTVLLKQDQRSLSEKTEKTARLNAHYDEGFEEAVQIVLEAGRGSVSLLQRKLRIGYNRAKRLIDQLEEADIRALA